MSPNLIELDSDVRLRPVIELAPASFGSCPDLGPGPWTAGQSARYWATSLAESGIRDLSPILPGSWFVSLDELAAPFPLSKVLEAHLDGLELPAGPEDLPPFSGGFVLYHGVEPILLPSCCGDLGNLADWRKAAAQRSDSPEMLWVGHPWFSTWFADGKLHIREEQDYPSPTPPRTVRLRPTSLEVAIARADRELDEFRSKLLTVLPAMLDSAVADSVARSLIGRCQ